MKSLIANRTAHALVIAACCFMFGCGKAKNVGNGFRFIRFPENQKVYLERAGKSDNFLEGTIEQAGWDENWIIVYVIKNYRGDTDGWYAVEIATGKIIGPFDETHIATDPRWEKIEIKAADRLL